jgi:23S rRNA (uracil1939-C5)-methyltransferase
MTFGPFGVGRVSGKTVMVPASVPGDLVEIEIVAERRNYALGRIVRVIQAAPERREPPCPYASSCGGCDWQQIGYNAQLRLKAEIVAAQFRQILGVELDQHRLVEPAPAEFGYRSRVRLKIGPGGKLGFHGPGSNSFVAVDACLVASPSLAVAARLAREFGINCSEMEVVAADTGEIMVADLTSAPSARERRIARQIVDNGATGIILRGGAARELFGNVRIALEAEPGCLIEADADLFSQVNRAQNLKLVATVLRLAEISPGARLVDLFCGSGNFSLPVSRRGAHVIGIDSSALAIDAAQKNVARMELKEIQFFAMRAVDAVRFLVKVGYRPNVMIIDPPRTGAADLIEPMVRLKAQRIVYVSCNPSSLVRDLSKLILHRYQIEQVCAFDFFPNTHHIEIVVSLLLT